MIDNIHGCRTFTYEDVMLFLADMSDIAIRNTYPCVTDILMDEYNCDSGVTYVVTSDRLARERSYPNIRCHIGVKEVIENRDVNVRDIDFVWAAKHIFHEAHHLYLMRNVYQRNMSGRDLDGARIDAISCLFSGYRAQIYKYAPSEVDADICGFEDTVRWFDEYLSIIDARECFVVKIREMSSWRGNKDVNSYDEVIKSLKDMQSGYMYQSRDNVFDERDVGLMNLINKRCPDWMPEIEKVRNGEIKNYVDVDRLLFSVALDINSFWIDHHAGLDEEVKTVRRQYPSKLKLSDKIASSISRSFNVRDVSDLFEDNQKSNLDEDLDY